MYALFQSAEALTKMLNDYFAEEPVSYTAECDEDAGVVIKDGLHDTVIKSFIIPTRESRTVGRDNVSVSTITVYLYSNGTCSEPVKFGSEQLLSIAKLVGCWGLNPFAEFGESEWDLFFAVAKTLIKHVELVLTCDYSDWSEDKGSHLFGTLRVESDTVKSMNSSFVTSPTKIDEIRSKEEVCNYMWNLASKLCKPPVISINILLYYLLSLLKSRLYRTVRLCPSFALGVIGSTGTRKTSVITPLANPINNVGCSFEDSNAAIRRTFQRNSNGCTVVDDFNCQTKEKNGKFEEIIRLSGDITSNGKRVDGRKVVTAVTTGMAVFTGEDFPKLQASSIPRILFLEFDKDTVDLLQLTDLQANLPLYRTFIILFLQYIMRQGEGFDVNFEESMMKRREQLRSELAEYKMHGRYHEMGAWMIEMWELLVRMLESYGVAVQFDFAAALKQHIIAQHFRFNHDPVYMFMHGFSELVDSNRLAIVDFPAFKNGTVYDVVNEDGVYFIASGLVYRKLVNYYKDQGLDYPCSERELRKLLHQEGILKLPGGARGKLTVERKTGDNKSRSGYFVYKSKLNFHGGMDNVNDKILITNCKLLWRNVGVLLRWRRAARRWIRSLTFKR